MRIKQSGNRYFNFSKNGMGTLELIALVMNEHYSNNSFGNDACHANATLAMSVRVDFCVQSLVLHTLLRNLLLLCLSYSQRRLLGSFYPSSRTSTSTSSRSTSSRRSSTSSRNSSTNSSSNSSSSRNNTEPVWILLLLASSQLVELP